MAACKNALFTLRGEQFRFPEIPRETLGLEGKQN